MFDPYDSPLMLPPSEGYYEPEAAPEPDRIDYALEGISRFMGLFALGITVTFNRPVGDSAAALSTGSGRSPVSSPWLFLPTCLAVLGCSPWRSR
jgi:hypothetical protein